MNPEPGIRGDTIHFFRPRTTTARSPTPPWPPTSPSTPPRAPARAKPPSDLSATSPTSTASTSPPHHRRLIETAWERGGGGREEYEGLILRPWAHMLGFRGHFLTTSRPYPTTFGAIRGDRRTYRLGETLAALDTPTEPGAVLVVNDWSVVHIGHRNNAEREIALGIPAPALYRWRCQGWGPRGRRMARCSATSPTTSASGSRRCGTRWRDGPPSPTDRHARPHPDLQAGPEAVPGPDAVPRP
ncbi:replication initiator [Pseudonocardia alni]|uniref:replication initiator n=1 Tax=Pseudonocardia alni TaxID=33907 RepID=UPI003402727B